MWSRKFLKKRLKELGILTEEDLRHSRYNTEKLRQMYSRYQEKTRGKFTQ